MEIKKVGISKVRPLKDGEYISCDKCGECKTKINQGYTRMMTDPEGELMVLHYIDQDVCAKCGCEDLTVCDEQDTYFDSNPFVYEDLLKEQK
jgi:hypothetical protein